MKGYRCDTCRDFESERLAESRDEFGGDRYVPPTDWLLLFPPGENRQRLWFCSWACLRAHCEKVTEIQESVA